MVSSMVKILARKAIDSRRMVAAKLQQILILSFFCSSGKNLGTHLADQAQVLVQDGKNHTNRGPICLGKVLYSHPGIFPNWSGDSGDEILGPIALLGIQVVVILLALPPYTLLIMR